MKTNDKWKESLLAKSACWKPSELSKHLASTLDLLHIHPMEAMVAHIVLTNTDILTNTTLMLMRAERLLSRLYDLPSTPEGLHTTGYALQRIPISYCSARVDTRVIVVGLSRLQC